MPDVSNPPGLTESGDVDHDETSNRTHDGDDLSPATLEADDGSVANSPTNNTDIFRLVDYTPEADTHDKTVSSDIVVTDSQVGTLADGEFLQNSGGSLVGGTVNVQGAFSNIDVFESDGTFDASNVEFAYVEVVGGGGGGSASRGNPNAVALFQGGGAGGYAAGYVDLSSESSVSVTVGSGGAGGVYQGSTSDNSGANGGSSSFGSFMSATGGTGGDQTSGNDATFDAPSGGSGSGGDINLDGGAGESGGAYTDTKFAVGASGGSTIYGWGDGQGATTQQDDVGYSEFSNEQYGNGGSAHAAPTTALEPDGLPGGDGVVIVRY